MKVKYSIGVIVLLFCMGSIYAQSSFEKDLNFIYENLKQTSSYKTQKNLHPNVEAKYKELKNNLDNEDLSRVESFIKLYELIDEIKDLHNDLYGNTETFSYSDLSDSVFVQNIRNDTNYNFYPISTIDLDSLKHELSTRSINDIDGIYNYETYFKIGVIKADSQLYKGIVLESKIASWQKGEVIMYLIPRENHLYRMFMGKFIDKQLISSYDYFSNGRFYTIPWVKEAAVIKETSSLEVSNEPYVFKTIEKDIQYLKL
ncbi:MAG TPA: hypothetical protein VLZ75_07195 [Chitinophagales bacterium]|nr:hypothetical protein [Chitinophagales bacterium]